MPIMSRGKKRHVFDGDMFREMLWKYFRGFFARLPPFSAEKLHSVLTVAVHFSS